MEKSVGKSALDQALLLEEDSNPQYQVYRTRWYVLGLFVLLATSQLCLWNTWGPIADTAKTVLDWTDADIALLTNWGCVTVVISAFFYSWLMDVKGLKWSVIIATACMFTGTAIRCIPVPARNLKWLMHCGQIVIGFGLPVMMAAPALLSATWFPPHQRTTSTAVATSASYLGPAVAYLIGPAVVREVNTSNSSTILNSTDQDVKQHHIDEIHKLMIIEFGVVAVLFLCVIVYFPARPPSSPSVSAGQQREDFKTGILTLIKTGQFWLPALCYAVSNGIFFAWQSELVVIFEDAQHVHQTTSGRIGFLCNIAGVIGAILFGRLIDIIGGKMKLILKILVFCGTGFALWIVLLTFDAIYFNIASLYVSSIGFGFAINAMVPVFFEMTVEGMFPVAEGAVTILMIWLMNVVCLIVLSILMIPNIVVSWVNLMALGGVIFCFPLLCIYKEQYNRLSLDVRNERSMINVDR